MIVTDFFWSYQLIYGCKKAVHFECCSYLSFIEFTFLDKKFGGKTILTPYWFYHYGKKKLFIISYVRRLGRASVITSTLVIECYKPGNAGVWFCNILEWRGPSPIISYSSCLLVFIKKLNYVLCSLVYFQDFQDQN